MFKTVLNKLKKVFKKFLKSQKVFKKFLKKC